MLSWGLILSLEHWMIYSSCGEKLNLIYMYIYIRKVTDFAMVDNAHSILILNDSDVEENQKFQIHCWFFLAEEKI